MKKSFEFFKMTDFFLWLTFFWQNCVFANISGFCDRISFLFMKALQTRMKIDVNNFFIPQVVLQICAKNTSFKNC